MSEPSASGPQPSAFSKKLTNFLEAEGRSLKAEGLKAGRHVGDARTSDGNEKYQSDQVQVKDGLQVVGTSAAGVIPEG